MKETLDMERNETHNIKTVQEKTTLSSNVENISDSINSNLPTVSLKDKKIKYSIVLTIIVFVLLLSGVLIYNFLSYNPYNNMHFENISGKTIADIAKKEGIGLKDFLEKWGLPKDMKPNTNEAVAFYMMPTKKFAQMQKTDFESLKLMLQFDDSITEDTPWGEAEGSVRLGVYIGIENLETFKSDYGFGDEVTGDTLWKDVKPVVDRKEFEKRKQVEYNAKK